MICSKRTVLFIQKKKNRFGRKHNATAEKPSKLGSEVLLSATSPNGCVQVWCAHTYTHMCTLTKAHFPSLCHFPSVSKNESFQSFLRPFCFCEALRLYPTRAWQEAYVSYSSSWTRQLCFSHTTWENVPSLNQLAHGSSGAKYSLCHRASGNVSISLSSSLYPGSLCVCVCVCVCFNQLLVFQSVPLFFFGTDDCSYKRYFSVLSSWLASNSQEVKKNLLLFSC